MLCVNHGEACILCMWTCKKYMHMHIPYMHDVCAGDSIHAIGARCTSFGDSEMLQVDNCTCMPLYSIA